MTDDCQKSSGHRHCSHTYMEEGYTYARNHEHSVWSVQSVVCSFARRRRSFFFFQGEFFLSLLFQGAFVPKNFVLVFFRHLKSSLLKTASFCSRPIFNAHRLTFSNAYAKLASIESAAKRDGIIAARLPGTINKCQIKYKHAA